MTDWYQRLVQDRQGWASEEPSVSGARSSSAVEAELVAMMGGMPELGMGGLPTAFGGGMAETGDFQASQGKPEARSIRPAQVEGKIDWYDRLAGPPKRPEPLIAKPELLPGRGRGLFGRLMEKGAETAKAFGRAVTGEGMADRDLPELGTSGQEISPFSREGLRMAAAYATSADPEQIADIAVGTLPGATKSKDSKGNLIVNFQGKDYFVNKPGLSEADLFQLVAQIGAYAPVARFGAAGSTMLRRMLRTGTAAAGTSAGLDVASGELGSKQGVDYGRAAVTGLAGSAFEGLSPLAAKAWNAIFRNPKLFDPATAALTAKGRETAKAAGFDPDRMGEKLSRIFAEEARSAADPGVSGARSVGREFDIPLSRGQATRDWEQLAREEAMRHGAKGEKAGEIMRAFDERQGERMTAASGRIQDEFAEGAATIAKPSQAGEAIKGGMQAKASAAMSEIDAAYAAAREIDARFMGTNLTDLFRNAKTAVHEIGVDRELTPATVRSLETIAKLGTAVKKSANPEMPLIQLREFELVRRKLGAYIGTAKNPTDRMGATRIKSALDDWLDDAYDNALFSGDESALPLLKHARDLRRTYGEKFEARGRGDEVGRVMQKIVSDDPTPEATINMLIGQSKLGQRDNSAKVVERLKTIFGDDSEEVRALREAGWLRLTRDATKPGLSPTRYAKNLAETMEKSETFMRSLYTPEQIMLMERFKNDVTRTVTPESVRNPSRTAFTISRLARDFIGRVGMVLTFGGNPAAGAALFAAKRAPDFMAGRAAQAATQLIPIPPGRAPALVAPGMAATGLLYER